MAIFKWRRSYVSYQVSGSRLYYSNSHVLIVCTLIRYEVMRDLEPLLNEPPQRRKSYYYAVYLHKVYGMKSSKSQGTRIAELEESAEPQPVCPIKGRIDSSVLFLFVKLQQ